MKKKLLWILVALILTCIVALCGVFGFDIPLYKFMREFDWRGWEIIGSTFNVKIWLAISLILVVIFYVRKLIQTKSKFNIFDMYAKIRGSYAFWVFCSVCSASVVGLVIKLLVGRMRPVFYEGLGITGFFPFAMDWAFHSMPSGHTIASFAGLVMLGLLAPRGRWFAWTLAAIIGISRVCIGAHWPSDVIVGAFVGTATAIIVKDILARRTNK